MRLDGGYGEIKNEVLYLVLSDLSDEERQEYEKKLREEDEKAYSEFKEWQKEFDG